MANLQIRKEVMTEIAGVIRAGKAAGMDGWRHAESMFPSIPSDVIAEAWVAVEDEATEAWWRSVEKTIEGEIIRNALAKGSVGP